MLQKKVASKKKKIMEWERERERGKGRGKGKKEKGRNKARIKDITKHNFIDYSLQVFYGTEYSNSWANRGNSMFFFFFYTLIPYVLNRNLFSFFLTIIPNTGCKLCLQSLFRPQLCYKSIVFPINNT